MLPNAYKDKCRYTNPTNFKMKGLTENSSRKGSWPICSTFHLEERNEIWTRSPHVNCLHCCLQLSEGVSIVSIPQDTVLQVRQGIPCSAWRPLLPANFRAAPPYFFRVTFSQTSTSQGCLHSEFELTQNADVLQDVSLTGKNFNSLGKSGRNLQLYTMTEKIIMQNLS
jgi:hypothetical protein